MTMFLYIVCILFSGYALIVQPFVVVLNDCKNLAFELKELYKVDATTMEALQIKYYESLGASKEVSEKKAK
jgi:hypothetical protein